MIRYDRRHYPRQQFFSPDIIRWTSAGAGGDIPQPAAVRRAVSQLIPRMARRRYLDEPCVVATFP